MMWPPIVTTGSWSLPAPETPSAREPTWAIPSNVAGRPGDPYLAQMRALGDVALRLHRIPKPTIAKVGGIAAGAGMGMALGCDLVWLPSRPRFSQIFAKRGLSVDFGASWLLPRLIGLHRAKELAFFADIIDAQEAAEFGFVNRVVPDDRAGRVRGRVGAGWPRPSVGPLDDQDHAEQLVQPVDGPGPRGGVPLARRSTSPRTTPWRPSPPSPEEGCRSSRGGDGKTAGAFSASSSSARHAQLSSGLRARASPLSPVPGRPWCPTGYRPPL